MTGWTAALVSIVLAANPLHAARTAAWERPAAPRWRQQVLLAVAVGFGVLVILAILSGPIRELLDVSIPTFHLASAIVLGLGGMVVMVGPGRQITDIPAGPRATLAFLVGAVLLLPPVVFSTVGAAGDAGVAAAIVGAFIGLALCAVLLLAPRLNPQMADIGARMIGAAAVATALMVGIEAARAV